MARGDARGRRGGRGGGGGRGGDRTAVVPARGGVEKSSGRGRGRGSSAAPAGKKSTRCVGLAEREGRETKTDCRRANATQQITLSLRRARRDFMIVRDVPQRFTLCDTVKHGIQHEASVADDGCPDHGAEVRVAEGSEVDEVARVARAAAVRNHARPRSWTTR